MAHEFPEIKSILDVFHQDIMIGFDGYSNIMGSYIRNSTKEAIVEALHEIDTLQSLRMNNRKMENTLWELGARGLPYRDTSRVLEGIRDCLLSALEDKH